MICRYIIFSSAIAALMAIIPLVSIPASAQDRPVTQNALQLNYVVESPESRLQDLSLRLQNAVDKLNRAKSRYEAGQVTADEYQDAKTEVARLEVAVKEAQEAAARHAQVERLSRPVDIQFKDATLQQAAESLSKASGVPIRIASSAPAGARISLEAKAVPLSTVLESIARHLDLKIAPAENGGVELQTWPEIQIDGQKQVFPEPTSPWSSAWGNMRPGANPGFGGFGGGGFSGGVGSANAAQGSVSSAIGGGQFSAGVSGAANQAGSTNIARNGSQVSSNSFSNTSRSRVANSLAGTTATMQQSLAASQMLQGVNIAAVGNTLVVAEPGRGPNGEPGAWLTVYLLEGTTLVKKSALFHPTRATLIAPGAAGFGSMSGYGGTGSAQQNGSGTSNRSRK